GPHDAVGHDLERRGGLEQREEQREETPDAERPERQRKTGAVGRRRGYGHGHLGNVAEPAAHYTPILRPASDEGPARERGRRTVEWPAGLPGLPCASVSWARAPPASTRQTPCPSPVSTSAATCSSDSRSRSGSSGTASPPTTRASSRSSSRDRKSVV